MEQQHEYIKTYLEALPSELRPEVNEKLKNALREAWRNEWEPKYLAEMVARGGFKSAFSPAGAALSKLERLAKEKHTYMTTTPAQNNFKDEHCRRSGCACSHRDCYRGWHDGGTRAVGTPNGAVILYDVTRPCKECRPATWERLNSVAF